jgi:hypothetical protein
MTAVHEAAEKLLPSLTTSQRTNAQRVLPGLMGPGHTGGMGMGHGGHMGMGPGAR